MLSLRYTPKKQTNFNNSSLEKCSNELLSLPAAKYHINISCILFTFAKVQLCTKNLHRRRIALFVKDRVLLWPPPSLELPAVKNNY